MKNGSDPLPHQPGGGVNYDLHLASFLFISVLGKPSGFPDYTLSQEKLWTDVLNKM